MSVPTNTPGFNHWGNTPVTNGELRHEFRKKLEERGLHEIRVNGRFDGANHNVKATVELIEVAPPSLRVAASFTLNSMPGCCGIMVSTQSSVQSSYRGKGIAHLMQEMKEYIGKRNRLGKLVATVIRGNAAEEAVLRKSGWVAGQAFTNRRTGNVIVEWEKVLTY